MVMEYNVDRNKMPEVNFSKSLENSNGFYVWKYLQIWVLYNFKGEKLKPNSICFPCERINYKTGYGQNSIILLRLPPYEMEENISMLLKVCQDKQTNVPNLLSKFNE